MGLLRVLTSRPPGVSGVDRLAVGGRGHSVLFQGWGFVPGTNWIVLMQDGTSRSVRVIVVLSPAFIGSVFGAAEW
jgi:hypothetical protein